MRKRNIRLFTILFCITIGAASFYVYLNNNKKAGLYNYIRKAQKYIDEGKYKKAVFLLHKAYEELPASKKIKENLINGYIRYARFLDQENDLDQAIDNMEMAQEIDPINISVMQHLTYLYSKKAIKMSGSKEFGQALSFLHKVIDIAMRSKKVRRNVSIYLFNEAINAQGRNDDNTVLLCLNTSYMLKPGFVTLDFFGQYYYRKANLENALFYWRKAQSIKPDDVDIREKIEKAEKEKVLKQQMRIIETAHFNVQLYRNYDVDMEMLHDVLEKVYSEVGEDFTYYPPANTLIMFYSEEDYREIFKQNKIVRAFYDGIIRIAFTADFEDQTFPALLAHEYTHAIVSMITDNKCPVWLHEGLAVFEQKRQASLSLENLKETVRRGEALSIKTLQAGFSQLDDESIVGLSYEGSYAAVLFILEKWGWSGINGLLAKIKEGYHYANAIDEEFYISVQTFEKMWNEWVKVKYGTSD